MCTVRLYGRHDGRRNLDTKSFVDEPHRFVNGVARFLEYGRPLLVRLGEELTSVGVIAHHEIGGHTTVGRRSKTVLAHVWIPKLL